MEFKYVMFNHCFVQIWNGPMSHVNAQMITDECKRLDPTSAGFFKIENGRVVCYGNSVTLGMSPGEFDEDIISKYLGITMEILH